MEYCVHDGVALRVCLCGDNAKSRKILKILSRMEPKLVLFLLGLHKKETTKNNLPQSKHWNILFYRNIKEAHNNVCILTYK